MILSKKLYLNRGFFKTFWLCLRHIVQNFVLLFRRPLLVVTDRSRQVGLPILTLNNSQELQCNACGLCIGYCPTQALDLSTSQDGKVVDFKLDVLRCISCSLCQEVCPIDAIRMGRSLASANHVEANWVLDAKELTKDGVVSRLAL